MIKFAILRLAFKKWFKSSSIFQKCSIFFWTGVSWKSWLRNLRTALKVRISLFLLLKAQWIVKSVRRAFREPSRISSKNSSRSRRIIGLYVLLVPAALFVHFYDWRCKLVARPSWRPQVSYCFKGKLHFDWREKGRLDIHNLHNRFKNLYQLFPAGLLRYGFISANDFFFMLQASRSL